MTSSAQLGRWAAVHLNRGENLLWGKHLGHFTLKLKLAFPAFDTCIGHSKIKKLSLFTVDFAHFSNKQVEHKREVISGSKFRDFLELSKCFRPEADSNAF